MKLGESRTPVDLRLPLLAAVAWLAALLGSLRPPHVLVLAAAGAVLLVMLALWTRAQRHRRPAGGADASATGVAVLLVLVAVLCSAAFRTSDREAGRLPALAERGTPVDVEGTVTTDPRPVLTGGVAEESGARTVVVRVRVEQVASRAGTWRTRSTAVVLGGEGWEDVRLGSRLRFRATPVPAQGDAAALLRPRGEPVLLAGPDVWWRAAEVLREGVRRAVEERPQAQRTLVPSLVMGDDAGMPPALADDFRTTGLTHLLAVSGTNLTLVLAFVLLGARWVGVRGRWRLLVGAVAVVGFVLVARSEPSVVRAAAMGTVAMLALGHDAHDRGVRTLAAAVLALLCWDPGMAVSAGFALSVLATAGILLLAPAWRDAMARWMPRWAAEAVAVPAAAQLACTPVVAGLSGEVSLVAVLANLLVAPAVAPVTVLGLAGGLLAAVWPALGGWVALPGAWAAGWIVVVAQWGASLPVPAVEWGTSGGWLAGLTVLCLLSAWAAPRLLRRPGWCVALVAGVGVVVLVPLPTPGWPPAGWVVAACDVGQGDALVLNAGQGRGVVVDAGPEPRLVERCLDRLGVREVPLLVLTHLHADHVDGLTGVLGSRPVGAVEVSPLGEPADVAATLARALAAHGLTAHVSEHLVPRQVGTLTLTRLWPPPGHETSGAGGGDRVNDASVVLLAQVGEVVVLLTGDVEPPAQRGLHRLLGDLEVDVLKVPHHGSRNQSGEWLTATGAAVALVSAGRDNSHGHPAPELVDLLSEAGMVLLRTDLHSDVVVVERDGQLGTATSSGVRVGG